jgi:N(6)-adenine-specific DNA methyltransferase
MTSITEIFRKHLPDDPKCLEVFARNLNENFTSIGVEVLKLQNELLYEKIESLENV